MGFVLRYREEKKAKMMISERDDVMFILAWLDGNPGATAYEVARATQLEWDAVLRLLFELEDHKVVSRRLDRNSLVLQWKVVE